MARLDVSKVPQNPDSLENGIDAIMRIARERGLEDKVLAHLEQRYSLVKKS